MPSKLKVGDVFEISLSDGTKAYGQFLGKHPMMGELVWIFDLTTHDEVDPDVLMSKLEGAAIRLGPVFTVLSPTVRDGTWRVIGRLPVKEDFAFPCFLSVVSISGETLTPWKLWDGERDIVLGRKLPAEYKGLEMLVIWSPLSLVQRIETGENRYKDIIEKG